MMGYRVREARVADRYAIASLWAELMAMHQGLDPRFAVAEDGEQKYARHVQELVRDRDGKVFVAEETATGDLVGYLLGELQERPPLSAPGRYGFISDLYVRENWRHRGVATALFEEMRLWCKQRRAGAIELYVSENNPGALEFWKSMGLTPFLKLVTLEL